MSITYLQVEYREKEVVKSLGARWDGVAKRWFIPSGCDPAAFTRWLPTENLPAISPETSDTSQRPSIRLSHLLNRVSLAVNQLTPQAEWVQAEISECRATKNGHVHLDLVELDAHKNLLGKASAKLFKHQAEVVLNKFFQATHSHLSQGMKVLLQVRVQFHLQFGFALLIEDIDPAYTLGDIQAKLAQIRETLQQEGLLQRNKQLTTPTEFYRLAVLSPQGAAGLGDFKQEADLLAKHHLCHFHYYQAQFQGELASGELCQALQRIQTDHTQQAFDAIVIIRGGGASIDLAWLNDVNVARLVCTMPVAVFSGIGHERDNTILDEVANKRFDTPSKVIGHILHSIVHNAQQAHNHYQHIDRAIRHVIGQSQQALTHTYRHIQQGAEQCWQLSLKDIDQYYHQSLTLSQHRLDTLNLTLDHAMRSVYHSAPQLLRQVQQSIDHCHSSIYTVVQREWRHLQQQCDTYQDQIRAGIQQACSYYQQECQKWWLHAVSLGPEATLARGFALAVDATGQVITSAACAQTQQSFIIRFQDGAVTVQPKGHA